MIWRSVLGIVAIAVGALWIGQGVGAVHGSFMTGHSLYTVLGVVVASFGITMIGWAASILTRRRRPPG